MKKLLLPLLVAAALVAGCKNQQDKPTQPATPTQSQPQKPSTPPTTPPPSTPTTPSPTTPNTGS